MNTVYLKYVLLGILLVVIFLGLALVLSIVYKKYVKKIVRRLQFRCYFNCWPELEKEGELRKLQIKTVIVPSLLALAALLQKIYIQENDTKGIMNQIDSGSIIDYKKMKLKLKKVRKEIKRSRRDFYTAKRSAEYLGFDIPKNFKDYIK